MSDVISDTAGVVDDHRRPKPDDAVVVAMSDPELVVAVARRDQTAFVEVYRRHAGVVYRFAARSCGPDRAADVTQEVFVALWAAPERFDPQRGRLRSFLLTQAQGRALDRLRADTARRSREMVTAPVESAGASVEREALDRLAGIQIREALAGLPEPAARAITLAFFAGYTYREVAEGLGQPEGTVKSRIRAGLSQLRTSLAEPGSRV